MLTLETIVDRLYDAIADARIVVSRREYRTLQDGDSIIVQLNNLRQLSISGLQELQDLLIIYVRRRSYRMRIDEEYFRRKLHNFKARFQDQYLAFQRICETANGREDWTNLSPNPPLQVPSPAGQNGIGHTTPDSKSTNSKITISAPPSPYQPTVEDVEDDPDEESPMVQHHYVRPDEAVSETSKEQQNTPPVVLIRAPTDGAEDSNAQNLMPKTSSGQVEATEGKETDPDAKLEQRKAGQKSSPKSPDLAGNSQRPPKVLALTEHDQRPMEDLQAELDDLTLGRNATHPSRAKAHHSSIELNARDDYSYPQYHNARLRAFTTPTGERPSEYQSGAEATKRVRTPKASPRGPWLDYVEPSASRKARHSSGQYYLHPSNSPKTPQSAVELGSSPWLADTYDWGPSPKQKTDQYGVNPRRSDPVLSGNEYSPAFGFAGPKRFHRPSEQFRGQEEDTERAGNDWLNTQDGRLGDFDLFGPSPSENEATTSSSRRSRVSSVRDSYEGHAAEAEESKVVEKHLSVTLEEMFYGTVKKLKIRRTIEDPTSRRIRDEERILDVPIYRGLKPGSKIKFGGEGGISTNGVKQDLHFVLVEKQHSIFTLRDRDLHCVLEIPLVDSLLGWQRTLTSICGKQIKVSHQGPTTSSWQECFPGLGMCSHKNPNERGDLFVGVKIKYPTSLNERQKNLIRDALQGK